MGLSEYVQPLDCVTVCVCPAMLMVAVRSGPVFAAVRKATVPLPDPLAPLVIVIQPCDGVAVQLQPDAVVGAVKYYVYRSTTGPTGPFSYINTTRAPGTSLQVAHLSPSTEYCYEVRTEDGTGPGAPSTPPACTTQPTGPNPPNAVVVSQVAPDRVNVSWTSVAGATKYYVHEASSLNGTYAIW